MTASAAGQEIRLARNDVYSIVVTLLFFWLTPRGRRCNVYMYMIFTLVTIACSHDCNVKMRTLPMQSDNQVTRPYRSTSI